MQLIFVLETCQKTQRTLLVKQKTEISIKLLIHLLHTTENDLSVERSLEKYINLFSANNILKNNETFLSLSVYKVF